MKVLVTAFENATTKTGSSFLRLQLTDDQKKTYNVVCFDPPGPGEDIAGKVCDVELEQPSNPQHRPKILSLSVLPDEDVSPYLRTSSLNVDEMVDWLKSTTRPHGELTTIIDSLIFNQEQALERFKTWPAAKGIHHAFQNGLLEHTYAMSRAAHFFTKYDPAYQGLDRGVIFCAIALHDFGKILEYDWSAPGPATRSSAGILLGHISMTDEMIIKVCAKNKIPTRSGRVLHLRHCILSHHGIKKWGSPVTPATSEAILIHQLDMIQSRGQTAKEALDALEPDKHVSNAPLETVLFKLDT